MKALHGYFLIVLTYICISLFNTRTYEYLHGPHENKPKLKGGKKNTKWKKEEPQLSKKEYNSSKLHIYLFQEKDDYSKV